MIPAAGVALGAGSALADNPGSGPEWSVDAAQDQRDTDRGGLLG